MLIMLSAYSERTNRTAMAGIGSRWKQGCHEGHAIQLSGKGN